MPCYRPVTGYKPPDGGRLSFVERKDHREVQVNCGQCIGCRIMRQQAWAVRCWAESRLHKNNCFLTLTYDDDHLPHLGSLQYRDVQLFFHRLRKKIGSFRFFACGEYGDNTKRPHYHVLLFGTDFPDKRKSNSMYSSHDLYTSKMLDDTWGKGFCSIGSVTMASAQYCAAYTIKKITGDAAKKHYAVVDASTGELLGYREPEFARMSLRPGIGHEWFVKWWKDVYSRGHNGVMINGRKHKIPRYFDKMLEVAFPDVYEDTMEVRRQAALNASDNSTRARLEVREKCTEAKLAFNAERKR